MTLVPDITDTVRQTVSDILGTNVPENAVPSSVEGWDSVNHLAIVSALEVTFGLDFSPDEIVDMIEGVEAICAIIERKTKGVE